MLALETLIITVKLASDWPQPDCFYTNLKSFPTAFDHTNILTCNNNLKQK